jgi:glycosyltransferase involved in cell wall biosynthesis
MDQNINPATGKPIKIVWFGDLVVLSGFGRIGNEITKRLKQRGYDVQGAGIQYSGWPHDYPFHIWPLANQDLWNGITTIVNSVQPDMLISCQDFPYHKTIWDACRIDFSKVKWGFITPIDGTPIMSPWLDLCQWADGAMTISRFGVEAFRQGGRKVGLCHPGIDANEFYPAEVSERDALRAKVGYAPSDFIVGVMAMNQGRKAIPPMIQAFFEFAKDKPNAKLYLDMDKISPAGWDIPELLKQMGIPAEQHGRVKYRDDLFAASPDMLPLRNRYIILDAHMVISHREGFGLPLLESMACRVPTIALDWCSGPEICGEGRGYIVKRLDYMEYGTWGGARDAFPDMKSLQNALESIYCYPEAAQGIAAVGYEWARRQTWDAATDAVEEMIHNAFKHERTQSHEPRVISDNATAYSDNRSPAYDERGHSVIQQPARVDQVPEKPVQNELEVRPAEPLGDSSAG